MNIILNYFKVNSHNILKTRESEKINYKIIW